MCRGRPAGRPYKRRDGLRCNEGIPYKNDGKFLWNGVPDKSRNPAGGAEIPEAERRSPEEGRTPVKTRTPANC